MRLINADVVKRKYRDKFIESLVDKDRGIDLSKYAEEPSKSFNKFIDEIPTVDVLNKIKSEIADIYCGQYCENPLTADAVREIALEIIDKYTAESEGNE